MSDLTQQKRPLSEYPGVEVRDNRVVDMQELFKFLPPQHIADCLGRWAAKQSSYEEISDDGNRDAKAS